MLNGCFASLFYWEIGAQKMRELKIIKQLEVHIKKWRNFMFVKRKNA